MNSHLPALSAGGGQVHGRLLTNEVRGEMQDVKWLSQIKRGLLELCILNLLARELG